MGRRFAAFVLAALGAGAQFFGAMFGQGMLGAGLLFGLGGPATLDLAAILGVAAACVSLVAAVGLMLVRDTRTAGRVLIVAAVVGTLAAGSLFALTALPAVVGGLLAQRIDPEAPVA